MMKSRTIRISDVLYDRVKAAAKAEGQSLSEFLRRSLLRECELVEERLEKIKRERDD